MDDSADSTLDASRDILRAIIFADEILLDDSERLAIVHAVVDAMARRLHSLGADPVDVDAAQKEALEATREAYVDLWIRYAYQAEGGSVDENAERRAALDAFTERGG